jgi:hypothetical protein
LDGAQGEAGRTDTLKIEVAGKVIAARAQRLERGLKMRPEAHIGADRRRRALPDRDADAVRILGQAVAFQG